MTEHGWERDGWPAIFEQVAAAHILVVCTPIWLGEKSSVCTQVIERLYGNSHLLNESGQYAYYGGVGGCLVTGNEDGVKHCAMNVLYSLQHLGYVIPPQADSGWIGEAGPGPSYLDPGSGGPANDFTNRNTTFMTWNLLHPRMLVDRVALGPRQQRTEWDAGCRFDFPNRTTAELRRLLRRRFGPVAVGRVRRALVARPFIADLAQMPRHRLEEHVARHAEQDQHQQAERPGPAGLGSGDRGVIHVRANSRTPAKRSSSGRSVSTTDVTTSKS
jgi:multimeric flavodoxin WrbA